MHVKPKKLLLWRKHSIESILAPDEQEKWRRLFAYFSSHKHALVLYYRRKGKQPPLPNEGRQPARYGSMEMRYENANIWLAQKMIAILYDVDVRTINEHIKKIHADGN